MKSLSPRIVVGVAILATPCLVFPLFKLFLGHCLFEQGCAPHEGLKMLGVLLASGAAGVSLGLIAATLVALFTRTAER